jgi:hypothetical protein
MLVPPRSVPRVVEHLGIAMKNTLRIFAFIAAALVMTCGIACAADPAAEKKEIEAFMHDYLQLWNAHDAVTITERIYRLDATNPWSTLAGLQAEFDRLKAQGYDRSDISSVIGCVIAPDMGQAELRFVRLKVDGTFMPPKDRVSVYYLKRFIDGWRVTGMKAIPSDQKMECPAK